MKTAWETIALSCTCRQCGKPVTIRVILPEGPKIDAARRSALCRTCWLSKSIRSPRAHTYRPPSSDP